MSLTALGLTGPGSGFAFLATISSDYFHNYWYLRHDLGSEVFFGRQTPNAATSIDHAVAFGQTACDPCLDAIVRTDLDRAELGGSISDDKHCPAIAAPKEGASRDNQGVICFPYDDPDLHPKSMTETGVVLRRAITQAQVGVEPCP